MNTITTGQVSFLEYSKKYDMLLDYTTPYQTLLTMIGERLEAYFPDTNKPLHVLDVGGGTGNFTKLVLDLYPNAVVDLVEPSEGMLAVARAKISQYKRVNFHKIGFEDFCSNRRYDLVLCVHALYLMDDSRKMVPKLGQGLKESGKLFVCDIGQEIRVNNWKRYYFFDFLKLHGLRKSLELFKLGKEVSAANRTIQQRQRNGDIWSHTLEEFKELFARHYLVVEGRSCYRGVSNFLVCGPTKSN